MHYESLNDAERVGEKYREGATEVWYMRPEVFRDLTMGSEFVLGYCREAMPDPKNLERTHVLVGRIAAEPEEVFELMQGDFWSPRGEARHLIERLGLRHTSMSVGDVIKVGERVLMIDSLGFYELAR